MSTLFAFFGCLTLTDFIVEVYHGYKGEFVISLTLLVGEAFFKGLTYLGTYRAFSLKTKLISHHVIAIFGFIAIPLLSLV